MISIKNSWNLRLQDKQMTLQLEIPEDTIIQSDFGLLEIILGNLVSNAVNYGHNQGLLVCRWQAETGILSVTDNGPGIPPKHLPHIFERFYRVKVPGSASVQSTGLGLYIVKMLADIQNINIRAESKINEGTQFYLHFNN